MIQPVCVSSHVLHDEYGTLKAVEDSIVTESPMIKVSPEMIRFFLLWEKSAKFLLL
ncbi:hypothetical protein P4V64_20035 [Bacillus thuringiensis]|nr:hypothetical protein [Bacillus thuringiensis]